MSQQGQVTYGSVFDGFSHGSDGAANLKLRAKLMDRLIDYVEQRGLTQAEAAQHFHVAQGRVSYLLNGKISKFTIDALVNMCTSAGIEVDIAFNGALADRDT